MNKQELDILVDKVNQDGATDEELALYTIYLNQITSGSATWDEAQLGNEEVLKAKLLQRIEAGLAAPAVKPTVKHWPQIPVAVAAVAAIVIGVYFFNAHQDTSRHPQLVSGSQEIAPGKNGATITLADGKVIQLSDAKSGVVVGEALTYSDGSEVGYSFTPKSRERRDEAEEMGLKSKAAVQDLTASTAKGQTYQVTLPDGTRVWLNADSKISFPSRFIGSERRILLSGEAYFVVVHNAKQPFRVHSKGQVVEDIGTAVNINAYADEKHIKTTLVEGSARVLTAIHMDEFSHAPKDMAYGGEEGIENNVYLMPKQQSILDGIKLEVQEVDVSQAVAWKVGLFAYNNTTLDEVMRQAARWYNVKVIYQEEALKKKKISGAVTRYDNISGLLKAVSYTAGVQFKIEGRNLLIEK